MPSGSFEYPPPFSISVEVISEPGATTCTLAPGVENGRNLPKLSAAPTVIA
ncbi:MAG: hypothetical protein O2942_10835 [Proteobacteria bacterium]|nr:hypothetical protein [Pseudomonadota bacterium]MDG4548563.1 hypothetical protein [Rickettsiales bacterium]